MRERTRSSDGVWKSLIARGGLSSVAWRAAPVISFPSAYQGCGIGYGVGSGVGPGIGNGNGLGTGIGTGIGSGKGSGKGSGPGMG